MSLGNPLKMRETDPRLKKKEHKLHNPISGMVASMKAATSKKR